MSRDLLNDIMDVKVTVASLVEKADSAHKRIDKNDNDVIGLRRDKHSLAGVLQKHEIILSEHGYSISGLKESISTLSDVIISHAETTSKNTAELLNLKTRADILIYMGGVFCAAGIGLIGFLVQHYILKG